MNKRITNKQAVSQRKSNSSKLASTDADIKYWDTTVALPINNAPFVFSLADIPQGTSPFERVAAQVKCTKLSIRAIINSGVSLLGNPTATLRFAVIVDLRQVASTVPNFIDYVNPVAPTGQKNYFLQHRWLVLHDQLIQVDAYNTNKQLVVDIPLSFKQRYSNANGNSIVEKGLYFLCTSDNAINPPTLDCRFRLSFIDP